MAKLHSTIMAVTIALLIPAVPALAAAPTVTSFTVAATAVSPVPVMTFTASDSDGAVVGYMVTQTSAKPSATDTRWTSNPWSDYPTSSIGALTLYAWAKDNANLVSSSRTASTNVVGSHAHTISQVAGLSAALDSKVNRYANVVIVAQSGGDYSDPASAIANIPDPSPTSPYLVKIMPGLYDLGATTLAMREYVDVEGSGEGVTVITSSGNPTLYAAPQIANSELRNLTVINTAAGPASGMASVAISIRGAAIRLTQVTAKALGTTSAGWNVGIECPGTLRNVTAIASGSTFVNCGIYNDNNAPTMINVTAQGTGGIAAYGISNAACHPAVMNDVIALASDGTRNVGIWNSGVTVEMNDVRAGASGGSEAYGIRSENSPAMMSNVTATAENGTTWNCGYETKYSTSVIDRSTFEGTYAVTSYGDMRIGASRLAGTIGGSGPFLCGASYDGDFAAMSATCNR